MPRAFLLDLTRHPTHKAYTSTLSDECVRLVGTAFLATLVLLAGCEAGVTGPTPTETAAEPPEATVSTNTSTGTPTPTRTTGCREPTPVANPEEITHRIGVTNQFEEPRTVTVELRGEDRSESRTKTFKTVWVPYTIVEPGTYTVRVTVNGTERVITTIEPPYGEYPTIADSLTSVVLDQNGSASVETSWEAVAPTPICT